jgi:hypothetical protein
MRCTIELLPLTGLSTAKSAPPNMDEVSAAHASGAPGTQHDPAPYVTVWNS